MNSTTISLSLPHPAHLVGVIETLLVICGVYLVCRRIRLSRSAWRTIWAVLICASPIIIIIVIFAIAIVMGSSCGHDLFHCG